jgi:hypothetical protein
MNFTKFPAALAPEYPELAELMDGLSESAHTHEGSIFEYAWRTTRDWQRIAQVRAEWAFRLAEQLAAITQADTATEEALQELLSEGGQEALGQGGHARQVLAVAGEHLLFSAMYPRGRSSYELSDIIDSAEHSSVLAADGLAAVYSTVAEPERELQERSHALRVLFDGSTGELAKSPWLHDGRPLWSLENARPIISAIADYALTVYLYNPILVSGIPQIDPGITAILSAEQSERVIAALHFAKFGISHSDSSHDESINAVYARALAELRDKYVSLGRSEKAAELERRYTLSSTTRLDGLARAALDAVLTRAANSSEWPTSARLERELILSLLAPFKVPEPVLDEVSATVRRGRQRGRL